MQRGRRGGPQTLLNRHIGLPTASRYVNFPSSSAQVAPQMQEAVRLEREARALAEIREMECQELRSKLKQSEAARQLQDTQIVTLQHEARQWESALDTLQVGRSPHRPTSIFYRLERLVLTLCAASISIVRDDCQNFRPCTPSPHPPPPFPPGCISSDLQSTAESVGHWPCRSSWTTICPTIWTHGT